MIQAGTISHIGSTVTRKIIFIPYTEEQLQAINKVDEKQQWPF